MNNKELTELKKEFESNLGKLTLLEDEMESYYTVVNPSSLWRWIESKLTQPREEIKREAEYRTTYAPILERSAVHRFIEDLDDRTIYDKEELLGIWAESYLTQKETQ